MNTQNKLARLKDFADEREFREFLIDFLKKYGFKNVFHTHRYGKPEQGKDIIAEYPHDIEGSDWYAFVVKKGRISGGTNEIETIKNQIKQSFEYPYLGINGNSQKINKVKVVTNENFTGGAQDQISGSPELAIYNNYGFWWGEPLVELIDKHYPEFWLPGDSFSKEYSHSFIEKLQTEIEIRELTIRKIDDKKIQKLLDIFIEPKLTITEIEEDLKSHEKKVRQENFSLKSITQIDQNYLISGEQGAGKTKILNTIACQLASVELISQSKNIPIRIKAPTFKENGFDILQSLITEVKNLSEFFFKDDIFEYYKPIIFVDDIDLLTKTEKIILISKLKEFCLFKECHYIITYRKNDFDFDKDLKTIRIHNFNVKQIEQFISKFFEGTDRGGKFIRILKESDLLSKLPTTPLTITLLSLLYDENNFEIPATLSDIYTDFTSVLLGKLDVRNRTDLLIFNLKRRIFTTFALKMIDEKIFEISYDEFKLFVNAFLSDRGYAEQSDEDLSEIIERSGLLYRDDYNNVGFKQQAFVEFLASLEIYHHQRQSHYQKLIEHFNDVIWQNTAIFYAGHSKELIDMIEDVIEKSPNAGLRDWFVNTGGMGYLAQALYQTRPKDRVKLVIKSLDNLIKAYHEIKKLTKENESFFFEMPILMICNIVNYWFNENFKSITLKATLIQAFEQIFGQESNFENNFKLLMISTTLMNPYINEEAQFEKLLYRPEFINHPILPLVADIVIESSLIDKKTISEEIKSKMVKQIKRRRELIRSILKEPAYRFNDEFAIE